MIKGYMGKLLFVDLSTGRTSEEIPDERLYRDFIGGYGVGAKILYSRQKPGIDPLGPENMLGFMTGPLTGTPATTGTRYAAVAKSPLTGGWGDANSGGSFGPHLKFAGYDGVFFTGISDKPVYLFIDNGKAELRDAGHLWGKNTYDTEDTIQSELGKGVEAICIGPAGEKLSLVSCIITHRGAAAARSGLGAVMGAKKLKAVAARGNKDVPVADVEAANKVRQANIAEQRTEKPGGSFAERHHRYGTTFMTPRFTQIGDAPIKNWNGAFTVDLTEIGGLAADAVVANVERYESCWHCPLGCQSRLKAGNGEYKYPAGVRRPEYETQAAFGGLCVINDTESIAMANHICNSYGLDTISAGAIIAFAMECYENGLINKKHTDGIELNFGNHRAMVEMTEKLAKREGFGDVLADGVKVAAAKIGKGAEAFAVHIGGQEPGMHDPKFQASTRPRGGDAGAMRYLMDATPGRHMQGFGPGGFRGHVVNAAGICSMAHTEVPEPTPYIVGFMSAVTGLQRSMDELLKIGERIANMRHVFNLREGINPLEWALHARIVGNPPLKTGPIAGSRIDAMPTIYWNLGALDWDLTTTRPSQKKLMELGLDEVIPDLYPPRAMPAPNR